MKTTADIDIQCTDGDYTLVSATKLPIQDEFVEQLTDLERILGDIKTITITFKEDKR
jgi:hypothetical protein